MLRRHRPAVVTLDIMMPVLSGWSFLEALAADEAIACTPVVIVSVADEMQRGYAMGATAVLAKPVNRTALLQALESTLGTSTLGGGTLGNGTLASDKDEKQRILVVDDDPTVRTLLSEHLKTLGYEVATAANGEEALALCAQRRPDLMILDLLMPVLSGFEVVQRLRENPDCDTLPIMILTSMELSEEEQAQLEDRVLNITAKSHFNGSGF